MSNSISPDEWMAAFGQTTTDFASSALGFDNASVSGTGADASDSHNGAYISLVGERNQIEMALMATPEACQTMARALMCMDETDEIAADEVADAMGEIMNILGGGVKTRFEQADSTLKLGLPIFIEGRIETTGKQDNQTAGVQLGPVEAQLLLISSKV